MARSYYDYDGFVEHALGSLKPANYSEDESPFRKALIYRNGGLPGVYLKGVHSNDYNPSYSEYYNMNISNLEKKGICHMMVNDGDIKSWVRIDDEII